MSGFSNDQIAVGQQELGVIKSLGLSPSDMAKADLITIETSLAESGLKNINYGDYQNGSMTSSRGPFQQIAAWGPLSAREDVAQSTRMFLQGGQQGQTGLLEVPNWDQINPWNAAQAVQQSEFSDGSNYLAQQDTATSFINQYGAGAPAVTPGSTPVGGATSIPPTSSASPGTAAASPASAITVQPAGLLTGFETTGLTFALEALFVLTGLGLVVLGVFRVSAPARKQLSNLPIPLPV